MGKTSYISKWEEGRPWLKPVKGKADKAHCSLCNKSFNIDKCGVSQVNVYSRGDSHQKLEKENLNQQKISISKVGEIKLTGKFVLQKCIANAKTAFKNGLQKLEFPYGSFFHDLSFFFHLSSARREDYKSLEEITHVTAHYVKNHGPTRWLSMKQVGVRVLEQLENLSEYFFGKNFLPKQKGFKISERYERIVEQLKRHDIEVYLAFMLFVSQDFESFLRFFRYDQPMIHMLWV